MIAILSSIIIALIVIGVLVIVHEFGHFIVAKMTGIHVEEFAVGMGKKLCSKQLGETEYSLHILPLGGYCRMRGVTEEGEIDERSFFSKSVGVRLAVMAAGPFMNFLLAIIFIFGLTATSSLTEPIVAQVTENSPAAEIGLQPGDEIYSINGKRIHIYDEMQNTMFQNGDRPVELEIKREDTIYEYTLTPAFSEEHQRYLMGFTPKINVGMFSESIEGYEKATFLDTARYSWYAMKYYVYTTAQGLIRVFTFSADKEEYGGPLTIIKMVGDSYEAGLSYSLKAAIQNVVYIAAVLSANLGVLNLFPIPSLDGGRILTLLIEAIRRKPLSMETESKLQFAGFLFIMGFMVFVIFMDITKIF